MVDKWSKIAMTLSGNDQEMSENGQKMPGNYPEWSENIQEM